jgi:hypothetical protein
LRSAVKLDGLFATALKEQIGLDLHGALLFPWLSGWQVKALCSRMPSLLDCGGPLKILKSKK